MKEFILFPGYCAALIAAGALLTAIPGAPVRHAPAAAPAAEESADNEFHRAEIAAYNQEGGLVYQLTSPRLQHFADMEGMMLARPRFEYRPESGAGLKLTSEHGRINDEGSLVHLDGAVKVRRPRGDAHEGETLTTRDVVIEIKRKTAHTDAHAVLKQGRRITEGDGMSADLASGEMRLRSNVRVIHAP